MARNQKTKNYMHGINASVDYEKIARAIEFYEAKGYKEIDVPWLIGKEAYFVTSKPYTKIKSPLGYHVASAEQSFLQLILDNRIEPGKYVACSPCYRDDRPSEYYNHDFIKVELINFLGHKKVGAREQKTLTNEILSHAKEFFEKYTKVKILKTKIGIDIMTPDNVEIGSYGYRTYKDFSWIYGTGLAEPRFSYCLSKKKRGYHDADIPRESFGTTGKIFEELYEYRDALKQKNPVMALLELSDLLGAIEGHLESEYKGTLTIDDLKRMKDTTRRAFRNGARA